MYIILKSVIKRSITNSRKCHTFSVCVRFTVSTKLYSLIRSSQYEQTAKQKATLDWIVWTRYRWHNTQISKLQIEFRFNHSRLITAAPYLLSNCHWDWSKDGIDCVFLCNKQVQAALNSWHHWLRVRLFVICMYT